MKVVGINSQDIQAKFQEANSNVCYGDSGGPAVIAFKDGDGNNVAGIVGITSFGNSRDCSVGGSAFFANTQGISIYNFIIANVPDAVTI